MTTWKVGDRVRLKETLPPEYDYNPEQDGRIVGVGKEKWGLSIVVALDEEFWNGPTDDGLREITEDHIKHKLERRPAKRGKL